MPLIYKSIINIIDKWKFINGNNHILLGLLIIIFLTVLLSNISITFDDVA